MLIDRGSGVTPTTGSIRIRAGIADEKVRLELSDSGVGFLPESESEGIVGIRERLSTLYGGDASLVLQQRELRATQAVLGIPYEGSQPAPG